MNHARQSSSGTVAREPESLASLLHAHSSFVARALKRFGVADADVEDGLQEVFLVVAAKLGEYEERGAIRAWLFTIARQVATNARRAALRRDRRERERAPAQDSDNPHDQLVRTEAARFVQGFLESLDPAQADVFFLAEIEGLSAPEIAECVGVGVNTVYGRLRLARERFERALKRHEVR